jgi:hypothetical protein
VGNWSPWNGVGGPQNFGDGFSALGDISGPFTPLRTSKISDITDGTSNTIMMAETGIGFFGGGFWTCGTGKIRYPNEYVFRTAFAFLACPGGYGGNENATYVNQANGAAYTGGSWYRTSPYAYADYYICAWGPNVEWPSASSAHPGGLQVVLGDGSVRFMSQTLDFGTWLKANAHADNNTSRQW